MQDLVTLPEVLPPGAEAVPLTFEEFYRDDDYDRARKPLDPAAVSRLRLVPLNVDQYHRMAEEGILPEGAPIELLNGILFWKDRREWRGKPLPTELVALTTDQYHRMIDAGILPDSAPIELLDGLLVFKDRGGVGEDPMTIGRRHDLVVSLLAELDMRLRPLGCYMKTQGPVLIEPQYEPEPDGAVRRGSPRDYVDRRPGPQDVYSVIEVSETSLGNDRTDKLAVYAQPGIPQYVIINLVDMQIEVCEEPVAGERRYARTTVYKAGRSFALAAGAGRSIEVPVAELLP